MIHQSVVIDPTAKIAPDVKIGPFCHIGKNVVLESGCVLESHIMLNDNVTCKVGVHIFSHVHVGNHRASIRIGERTHIREFSLVGTDASDADVSIDDDNFIMAYCRISNGTTLGAHTILTNGVTLEADVILEEKVIVGGLSTVTKGNRVGSGVMIGGASYATHDMPPFCLVEGNPATVKGLNIIGLRRRLENRGDITLIKQAFKRTYRHGINKEAAKALLKTEPIEYVERFCNFLVTSNEA